MEHDVPDLPRPVDVEWNRWDLLDPRTSATHPSGVSVVLGPSDTTVRANVVRRLVENVSDQFPVEFLVPAAMEATIDGPVRRVEVPPDARPSRYRNAAVEVASHDVLLFVATPADVSEHFIAQHLKWHIAYNDLVVLGQNRRHPALAPTSHPPPAAPTDQALHPVPDRIGPVEGHLLRTRDLTTADSDLFRFFPVSNVSLRRETLTSVGGFTEQVGQLQFQHPFDEVLGYRLFQRGHIFVYEREAIVDHAEAAADNGVVGQATREVLTQMVAHPAFRDDGLRVGRIVPRWRVTIQADDCELDTVRRSLGSVLSHGPPDLAVVVDPCSDEIMPFLEVMAQADARIRLPSDAEAASFPSLLLSLPAGSTVSSQTFGMLEERLEDASEPIGVLRITVPEHLPSDAAATAIHARAYLRCSRLDEERAVELASAMFGQKWISGLDIGLSDGARPPSGAIPSESPAAKSSPDELRELWDAVGDLPPAEREQLLQAGRLALRAPRWLRRVGFRLARILAR